MLQILNISFVYVVLSAVYVNLKPNSLYATRLALTVVKVLLFAAIVHVTVASVCNALLYT